MKVIVFDLDDTLYDESTYVASGFRAVAAYLERQYGLSSDLCYAGMRSELAANGRGKVFDRVLRDHELYSQARVRECLSAYRRHEPQIRLHPDAERCLRRLGPEGEGFPLYIVTDGNQHVQLRKLQALGLYTSPLIRRCLITRRYGVANEKPSTYCFRMICDWERAAPQDVVYIGDNPRKDFVGIKREGFRTVRILRGHHREVRLDMAYEAAAEIEDLDHLDAAIRLIEGRDSADNY